MNFLLVTVIFFVLLFDKLNIFFYLILASFMHETGHIAACLICGYRPVLKITLFGICLFNYPDHKIKKLFVLVSGPAVNGVMAAILFYLMNNSFSVNIYVFYCVNLLLFIFNLLPVSFLDGGQIAASVCKNVLVLKIMDIIALTVALTLVLQYTEDTTKSLLTMVLFGIYYYINKKSLLY